MESKIHTHPIQNINRMYKKLIFTLLLAGASFANAQVIIGGATGTATVKTSVLLEFPNTNNKGIIVPYVRAYPTGAALVGGSIILDARTATTARMKYYNGATWVDLSGQDADLTSPINYMTVQPSIVLAPEAATSQAIIGSRSSSADGVLVLESTTKAMVLPTVDQTDSIVNPSPGMMVYIKGVTPTFNKRLAVYNGSKWSFWKP